MKLEWLWVGAIDAPALVPIAETLIDFLSAIFSSADKLYISKTVCGIRTCLQTAVKCAENQYEIVKITEFERLYGRKIKQRCDIGHLKTKVQQKSLWNLE